MVSTVRSKSNDDQREIAVDGGLPLSCRPAELLPAGYIPVSPEVRHAYTCRYGESI